MTTFFIDDKILLVLIWGFIMKKIILIFSLIIMSFSCAFALEEGLSINILPSGQKVIIKEVKDNAIVKIDTWINTGAINEDDKTTGISHFLEHLFFKGTQKYPTGTMDKILDSKGAVVNAGTSKDYTHYYIQIPSEYFDLALELHADMLQNPLIPRKELERERPVVIEEISKTKDSPTSRMFDNLYSVIYSKSNHPYKRNVIGKKEVIETVTREEILDYYNKFYTPDAYTTVIVGDVDKQEALKKVADAFELSLESVKGEVASTLRRQNNERKKDERAELLRQRGQEEKAQEYRQLWDIVVSSLEQCAAILGGLMQAMSSNQMMSSMGEMSEEMKGFMNNMRLNDMLKMAGDAVPMAFKLQLNQALNQIKK